MIGRISEKTEDGEQQQAKVESGIDLGEKRKLFKMRANFCLGRLMGLVRTFVPKPDSILAVGESI